MIPSKPQCLLLFDRYNLPTQKKIHVEAVTELALYLGQKLKEKGVSINLELLEAAALLHDIDKNITKQAGPSATPSEAGLTRRAGERHPDTAVRILKELGFAEVAEIVRKHSLHCILNEELKPITWEEKLVYLADKMTKFEVIGVEHRFKLWYKENLPPSAVKELDASLPLVKKLEQEVYQVAGITFEDIQKEFSVS